MQRALNLATRPLAFSQELRQLDRRELDDAVFELLAVASATERRLSIDRLYTETATHFRAIRSTEILERWFVLGKPLARVESLRRK